MAKREKKKMDGGGMDLCLHKKALTLGDWQAHAVQ